MADTQPGTAGPALLRGWARLPVAIGVGALMALGQAPYDLWPVAFLGFVAAFWLFRATPGGVVAAGTGWAIGLGYFGLALGWIVEPFQIDPATRWMAPFGLVGMAAGLALFWALPFWAAGQARRDALPLLVLGWSAAELARAYVLTGFPWALVAYLWIPATPIQWVSVIGPHGLTLVTLSAAALCAAALPPGGPRAKPAVAALVLVVALFAGGAALLPAEPSEDGRPVVRIVQPDAPQHEKWDPAKIPVFFDRQIAYTEAPPTGALASPALIVWPETALPMLLARAGDALAVMADAAGGARLAAGIQRGGDGVYFNSLVTLDASGRLGQVYDKHHLVPFGEYMPAAGVFARWNIFGLAARAQGGYTPGPGPRLLDFGPLGRALPLICYEAVFPQDVQRAPARADFLLHVTNDAWFGQWSGPYQHLAQARVRAIEQGLPLLRSANTGVSAVIDGGGRVREALPLGQAGFIDAVLPAPLPPTPYSRTGDLPVLVLLVLFTAGLLLRGKRQAD